MTPRAIDRASRGRCTGPRYQKQERANPATSRTFVSCPLRREKKQHRLSSPFHSRLAEPAAISPKTHQNTSGKDLHPPPSARYAQAELFSCPKFPPKIPKQRANDESGAATRCNKVGRKLQTTRIACRLIRISFKQAATDKHYINPMQPD